MKLYIEAFGSYRSDTEDIDVKKELKQKYKLDTRRQDPFIHLALLGAQRLKENTQINTQDELYITTEVGNIDILQKTHEYVTAQGQFIRPFDFINMLGNTTSFYVALSLGVKDKNIFQVSDNFTFINSLISIYASLNSTDKKAILGTVNLLTKPDTLVKKMLGVLNETQIVSSSSFQKISMDKSKAIAEIEFDIKTYDFKEIKEFLKHNKTKVMFSNRCEAFNTQGTRFFETTISNTLSEHIKINENLIIIDCYNNKYKILNLINSIIS